MSLCLTPPAPPSLPPRRSARARAGRRAAPVHRHSDCGHAGRRAALHPAGPRAAGVRAPRAAGQPRRVPVRAAALAGACCCNALMRSVTISADPVAPFCCAASGWRALGSSSTLWEETRRCACSLSACCTEPRRVGKGALELPPCPCLKLSSHTLALSTAQVLSEFIVRNRGVVPRLNEIPLAVDSTEQVGWRMQCQRGEQKLVSSAAAQAVIFGCPPQSPSRPCPQVRLVLHSTWPACTQPDPDDPSAKPFTAQVCVCGGVLAATVALCRCALLLTCTDGSPRRRCASLPPRVASTFNPRPSSPTLPPMGTSTAPRSWGSPCRWQAPQRRCLSAARAWRL